MHTLIMTRTNTFQAIQLTIIQHSKQTFSSEPKYHDGIPFKESYNKNPQFT